MTTELSRFRGESATGGKKWQIKLLKTKSRGQSYAKMPQICMQKVITHWPTAILPLVIIQIDSDSIIIT